LTGEGFDSAVDSAGSLLSPVDNTVLPATLLASYRHMSDRMFDDALAVMGFRRDKNDDGSYVIGEDGQTRPSVSL